MTNYAFIYDIINDVIILGMEESQINHLAVMHGAIIVIHGAITVKHGAIIVMHGAINGHAWCNHSCAWCNHTSRNFLAQIVLDLA